MACVCDRGTIARTRPQGLCQRRDVGTSPKPSRKTVVSMMSRLSQMLSKLRLCTEFVLSTHSLPSQSAQSVRMCANANANMCEARAAAAGWADRHGACPLARNERIRFAAVRKARCWAAPLGRCTLLFQIRQIPTNRHGDSIVQLLATKNRTFQRSARPVPVHRSASATSRRAAHCRRDRVHADARQWHCGTGRHTLPPCAWHAADEVASARIHARTHAQPSTTASCTLRGAPERC